MTLSEAQVVADIIATADSGCTTCVKSLATKMTDAFPEFVFELNSDDEIETRCTARLRMVIA